MTRRSLFGGGADTCGDAGGGGAADGDWTAGVDPGTDRTAAVVAGELSFTAHAPVPLYR
jgi:hypothetical protein